MNSSPYFMRDLNGDKVDMIMRFDVKRGRNRSRSVFEISLFLGALAAYLCALAISA